jgi:hypothetical protein
MTVGLYASKRTHIVIPDHTMPKQVVLPPAREKRTGVRDNFMSRPWSSPALCFPGYAARLRSGCRFRVGNSAEPDVPCNGYETLQKFPAIVAFLEVFILRRGKGAPRMNQNPGSVNWNVFTHTSVNGHFRSRFPTAARF